MWDLWWAKWQWDRSSFVRFGLPWSVLFYQCSTSTLSSVSDAVRQEFASFNNVLKELLRNVTTVGFQLSCKSKAICTYTEISCQLHCQYSEPNEAIKTHILQHLFWTNKLIVANNTNLLKSRISEATGNINYRSDLLYEVWEKRGNDVTAVTSFLHHYHFRQIICFQSDLQHFLQRMLSSDCNNLNINSILVYEWTHYH